MTHQLLAFGQQSQESKSRAQVAAIVLLRIRIRGAHQTRLYCHHHQVCVHSSYRVNFLIVETRSQLSGPIGMDIDNNNVGNQAAPNGEQKQDWLRSPVVPRQSHESKRSGSATKRKQEQVSSQSSSSSSFTLTQTMQNEQPTSKKRKLPKFLIKES